MTLLPRTIYNFSSIMVVIIAFLIIAKYGLFSARQFGSLFQSSKYSSKGAKVLPNIFCENNSFLLKVLTNGRQNWKSEDEENC